MLLWLFALQQHSSGFNLVVRGRMALELLKERRWPKASLLQGSLMPNGRRHFVDIPLIGNNRAAP
jgi:hypothetical protein